MSWEGWSFPQTEQPLPWQHGGTQHPAVWQRLLMLELTQPSSRLRDGTVGASQPPQTSGNTTLIVTRSLGYPWLLLVIPKCPMASQGGQPQWRSGVPPCGETCGEHGAAGRKPGSWHCTCEAGQTPLVKAIFNAFHCHQSRLMLLLLTSKQVTYSG